MGGANIRPRGKVLLRYVKLITKIANLILFSFEIVVMLICQDEIEQYEPGLDELDGMLPAIADILFANLPVKPLSEEVVDPSGALVLPPCGMAAALNLLRQTG